MSNTADKGYLLDAEDSAALLQRRRARAAQLSGEAVGAAASALASRARRRRCRSFRASCSSATATRCATSSARWRTNGSWQRHSSIGLGGHCVWANTLVDRIVSAPIEPVGAIAEPYALWAIERQPRLVLPCGHPAIVLTDELEHYERLKLFLLNGGHTLPRRALAARGPRCRAHRGTGDERRRVAPRARGAVGARRSSRCSRPSASATLPMSYLVSLRGRLQNPFLAIAWPTSPRTTRQKKKRRFEPIVALAERHAPMLPQPRLRAALADGGP